jgi:hypothetical protein
MKAAEEWIITDGLYTEIHSLKRLYEIMRRAGRGVLH